jgi:general secretion pathway protein N
MKLARRLTQADLQRASRDGPRPAPAASAFGRLARWAWLGMAIGALASLTLFAPARWLSAAIAAGTRQQVMLADAQGTLWNGSARLVLTGGEASQDAVALPGRVRWTLRPGFTQVHAEVFSECCTPLPLKLRAAPRWQGAHVEIDDGQARWQASLLTGLGAPWNTLQPEGEITLQSRGLAADWVAGRLLLGGSAVLEGRNIESRLATLRPLGSYRVRVQGGQAISLTLETIEGGLLLAGSGQVVGNRLRFTGEASAAPDREAALANFLNVVGRRDGPRSIITIG